MSSNGGSLTKSGAGILTLNGTNTYVGSTTVTGGTLALGKSDAIANGSNLIVDGGNFDLGNFSDTVNLVSIGANGGSINSTAGILTGASYSFSNTGTNTATISAILAGPGSASQIGDGKTFLSGNNSYTGITNVDAGTLAISSNQGLGATTGATVVRSGATLELRGAITSEQLTISGSGSEGRGAIKVSENSTIAGQVVLDASSRITVDSGKALNLDKDNNQITNPESNNSSSIGATGTVPTNRNLEFNGLGTINLYDYINNAVGVIIIDGIIVNSFADIKASGDSQGVDILIKNAGSLSLNNVNDVSSWTNSIQLSNGTLKFPESKNFGSSASLNLSSDNGNTIEVASGKLVSFPGIIGNKDSISAGFFRKSGGGTFEPLGVNTYTGGLEIKEGTLKINSDRSLGAERTTFRSDALTLSGGTLLATNSHGINPNRGITLQTATSSSINVSGNSTLTYEGQFTGNGTLTKLGTGILRLGSNTYSGQIIQGVDSGQVQILQASTNNTSTSTNNSSSSDSNNQQQSDQSSTDQAPPPATDQSSSPTTNKPPPPSGNQTPPPPGPPLPASITGSNLTPDDIIALNQLLNTAGIPDKNLSEAYNLFTNAGIKPDKISTTFAVFNNSGLKPEESFQVFNKLTNAGLAGEESAKLFVNITNSGINGQQAASFVGALTDKGLSGKDVNTVFNAIQGKGLKAESGTQVAVELVNIGLNAKGIIAVADVVLDKTGNETALDRPAPPTQSSKVENTTIKPIGNVGSVGSVMPINAKLSAAANPVNFEQSFGFGDSAKTSAAGLQKNAPITSSTPSGSPLSGSTPTVGASTIGSPSKAVGPDLNLALGTSTSKAETKPTGATASNSQLTKTESKGPDSISGNNAPQGEPKPSGNQNAGNLASTDTKDNRSSDLSASGTATKEDRSTSSNTVTESSTKENNTRDEGSKADANSKENSPKENTKGETDNAEKAVESAVLADKGSESDSSNPKSSTTTTSTESQDTNNSVKIIATNLSPSVAQQDISVREQANTDQIRQKLPGTSNLPANDLSVSALRNSLGAWTNWVRSQ